MHWPRKAAQPTREVGNLHPCAVVGVIHNPRVGHEQHVGSLAAGNLCITLGISGVGIQIFAGPKLGGIDKKAHHQALCLGAGIGHKVFVPLMVIAHGGNQSYVVSGFMPGLALRRQFFGIC